MQQIVILGGGAAGMAAALAAAQAAGGAARITLLDRNPRCGKSCWQPATAAATSTTPASRRSAISPPTPRRWPRCWRR